MDGQKSDLGQSMLESVDSMKVLGLIFVVLTVLVAFNIFLYFKVNQLEKDSDSFSFFPSQEFSFT